MTPFKVARDMLDIHADIFYRTKSLDFEIYMFDQTWGSTALGFGGMGGQAITTETTYVLIPDTAFDRAVVYFGGRFAYVAVVNDAFRKDLADKKMASVAIAKGRYA